MMEEPLAAKNGSGGQAATHIVHALMQFAMAVKQRKNVLVLCVFLTLVLGGLYYMTATRYYAANAELFVMASGEDALTTGFSGQGRDGKNLMPTFERLITSSTVVEQAIERLQPEHRVDLAELPKSKWGAAVQENLSAKAVYNTNNIEIEYLSRDPAAAVAVVTEILQAYHKFMDQVHKGTAESLIHSLHQQQTEINQQLTSWQTLLEQRRRECGDFLGTDTESRYTHPILERHLNVVKEQWNTTEERFDIEAKLRGIEQALANGDDLQAHVMAVAETVGREMLMASLGLGTRDAAKMAELEKDIRDDHAALASLQKHYGFGHPKVDAVVTRIRENEQYLANYSVHVQDRMNAMQGRQLGMTLVQVMRQQAEATRHREILLAEEEANVRRQAEAISGQRIAIQAIERQIEWGNGMRDRLLDRMAGLTGAEDGPIIRTQVVTAPVRATSPASPNPRRVVLMALILGMGIGLAVVYVLDTLDDRFRSVEELQSQAGVPVLAMVQELPARHATGIAAFQLAADPDSPESEAFRTLRTGLGLTNDQSRRIVVTSAEPGDGKTTVLANTAIAYANSGKRTLLIDADLRRPSLTAMLGLQGVDGLSAIIRSQEPVSQTAERHIRRTAVQGLDVLPSGPRPANPAELLGGQQLAELLAWAESRYDRIFIDSPPALAASDTAVIGRLVDGVLMVVQPAKNRRRMVLRATESLALLKISIVGLVANRVGGSGEAGYYAYGADMSDEYETEANTLSFEDELDCPPELTGHPGGHSQADGDAGIDLGRMANPRRRGAA